jgi:hypothetical protein
MDDECFVAACVGFGFGGVRWRTWGERLGDGVEQVFVVSRRR